MQFGDNTKPYPEEMRVQLWPLCCGASIISGFKNVGPKSVDEVLEDIEKVLNAIPDHQVYANETIVPRLTYLTLNAYQMRSDKIMEIVTKAGFVKFAEASPRGSEQGFFVRDMSKTFKLVA